MFHSPEIKHATPLPSMAFNCGFRSASRIIGSSCFQVSTMLLHNASNTLDMTNVQRAVLCHSTVVSVAARTARCAASPILHVSDTPCCSLQALLACTASLAKSAKCRSGDLPDSTTSREVPCLKHLKLSASPGFGLRALGNCSIFRCSSSVSVKRGVAFASGRQGRGGRVPTKSASKLIGF